MEEYLECIICYDVIDKNIGDYLSDICNTCKYGVHITCYEEYITFNKKINNINIYDKCLMCHKYNMKYNNQLNNDKLIQVYNPINIYNRFIRKIIVIIFIIIILISIIIWYIYK